MNFPNHMELVELWMVTHFTDKPAIVFFDPLGNGDRIELFKERLGIVCGTSLGKLINCDVYIHPESHPESILGKLHEDDWGYAMSWDGRSFTSENT